MFRKHEISSDKVHEYYKNLNKRLGENNYLELDEDEIKYLELIFKFYNNTKDELSELKLLGYTKRYIWGCRI